MMFLANIWIKSSERLLRPPQTALNSLTSKKLAGHDGTRMRDLLREVGVLTKWENAYLANEKRGGARSHPGRLTSTVQAATAAGL